MKEMIGYQILLKLMTSKVLTGQDLADQLKTTSSEIRNEINHLNHILTNNIAQIKVKRGRGNGYSLIILDAEKYEEFLEQYRIDSYNDSQLMNQPMRRVETIAMTLLNSNEDVKLEYLSEMLSISSRQANNDLKVVRKIFSDYMLKIVSRPYYGMHVEGSEFNKRLCLANLYIRNMFASSFNDKQQMINNAEMDYQINQIRTIVIEESSNLNIEFSDIALDNLVIHIFVMIKRLSNNYEEELHVSNGVHFDQQEFRLSKHILSRIEEEFNLKFSNYDNQSLEIHIAGKRAYVNEDISLISREAKELTEEVLSTIDSTYQTNLRTDEQLGIRLCLHFTPLLIRIRNNIISKNPIGEDVKVKYALSNEMAVIAGKIINQKFNVHITQDELSFIALHFELSAYQINMRQYKILLICHTSKSNLEILKQQIINRFSNYISQIDTCYLNQINKFDLDSYTFILCTTSIKLFTRAPVYKIDSFIDDSNVSYINNIFKLGDFMKKNLEKYFPKELFIANLNANTKEETIAKMVNVIKKYKVIPENFYESVLERELLSSTDYGNNVAIPHPMTKGEGNTYACVAILAKPVNWGNNMVKLVLLNSINNISNDLQPYYYLLTKLVSNSKMVNHLIQNPTYENLISIIRQL